jgi:CubicO group peptidase (beta-lactamase class C family)
MRGMTVRIRSLAVAVAIALLCTSGVSTQAGLPAGLAEKLDALVAAEFAKDGVVGAATVGVVKGGALAWAKGYGVADIEAGTRADAGTVYRIGSITKPFTAVMLLQLVERGKVKLSDPVERYLPDINKIGGRSPGAPPVTFVQLATMTAGIDREPDDLDTFLVGPVEQWEQVMLRALEKTKYAHEPGTRFLYSNIGYAILGAALGRVAKQPYVEYMRASVLAPLGMKQTDFVPTPEIRKVLAKGYELRNGKPDGAQAAREHDGRGYKVPNGAIYTTVGDLAKFVSLWLQEGPETVLKRETIRDNLSRTGSATGDLTSGYGIGFQVTRRGTTVFYGHGGSVAGYRAQMLFHPATKTGVIVLRNVGGGPFNPSAVAERVLTLAMEDAR